MNTDPDGDGVMNEMTRADVTAVAMFQATLAVPGRVIPNNPEVERAVLTGERVFARDRVRDLSRAGAAARRRAAGSIRNRAPTIRRRTCAAETRECCRSI